MIPQDTIDGYLACLLGNSEPGAVLHHLLVATTAPGAETALGVPSLSTTIYAIAPESSDAAFIARAVMAAVAEAREKKAVIQFAGLASEVFVVMPDGNEVTENRARILGPERRLHEHPSAIEMTTLYAACRDGRRWIGHHFVTGPKAGTIFGPQALTGALYPDERARLRGLICAAVDIGPLGRFRCEA